MKEIISRKKQDQLIKRMSDLSISEKDIEENFITSGGPGGQHANRNATCVYLKHLPTGTEVKCAATRYRQTNRFLARRILTDKIEEQLIQKKSRRMQEIEKIRRQKRKRSRRAKEKILRDKKINSEKKASRKIFKDSE